MNAPLRIAVIDSGVHASHPHVNGVAGGVSILPDGREADDYVDRIGHGTAVAAAIREKAPEVDLFAVKIFQNSLATRIEPLVAAIDWSLRHGMDLINLSLGTNNPAHETLLRAAVDRVLAKGALLIAAHETDGVRWLPGVLQGVLPVALDWACPREQYRTATLPDGRTVYRASGFPRPVPGLPPECNLKGLSFAVANVTGLIARQIGEGRDQEYFRAPQTQPR
jgi:subtilisin family serine protease